MKFRCVNCAAESDTEGKCTNGHPYTPLLSSLPFLPEAVHCAYIGKQGCACGCRGKYYYGNIKNAEDWQLFVPTQKANTRGIKTIYNKLLKLVKEGHLIETIRDASGKEYIFQVETRNDQAYRLYLHD